MSKKIIIDTNRWISFLITNDFKQLDKFLLAYSFINVLV